MRAQGPNVCPECGERVTMFAAGCALRGAKLDPGRAQHPSIAITFPLRLRLTHKRAQL
jgi:hypothetical protein